MEAHIADPTGLETANNDVVGPGPLRKDHGLGLRRHKQLLEQRGQFVSLDAVVGLLIQQIGAVAGHAHVLKGAGQASLILVREKPGLAPALDNPGHDVRIFLMKKPLRFSHWNQRVLVRPARQLLQHLRLSPADHDRRQGSADPLQPRITGDAAGLVLDLMFVQEFPGWAQPVLIDELHDRDQFFQLVLQGRRLGRWIAIRAKLVRPSHTDSEGLVPARACRLRVRLSPESQTRRRSPEVRSTAFPARPPDLPPQPLMTVDFAIIGSLVRLGRPRYPAFVHRAAGLLHASFRALRFANPSPPSGWVKDSHLQAVDHARHTKKGAQLSRAGAALAALYRVGRTKIWPG